MKFGFRWLIRFICCCYISTLDEMVYTRLLIIQICAHWSPLKICMHAHLWKCSPSCRGQQCVYVCNLHWVMRMFACDPNCSIKIFICVLDDCALFIFSSSSSLYSSISFLWRTYHPNEVNGIDSTMNLHKLKWAISSCSSFRKKPESERASKSEWVINEKFSIHMNIRL